MRQTVSTCVTPGFPKSFTRQSPAGVCIPSKQPPPRAAGVISHNSEWHVADDNGSRVHALTFHEHNLLS